MKKTLLLSAALGLASVSSLKAVDLYVTGSTAFRAQVYTACQKLFVGGAPATQWDTAKVIGGDGTTTSSNPVWTMTGTPISSITNVTGTLTIHADFTGSVQGCQTVESATKLLFLSTTGSVITNTPTIAFSDVSSQSTPYAATGNFSEEQVAVQPFAFFKSIAGGPLTNITNITWEQVKYLVQAGRIPLSTWTGKPSDHGTYIYMINRTKDSGTRRTTFAYALDGYNQSAVIYNYDATNNVFYKGTNTLPATAGGVSNGIASFGVIGAAGNNNANLNWGPGYVGGGDIKNELKLGNANNLAIGYLSLSDGKAITGTNWSQMISLNGNWPTAAGAGISGNTGTNDYTPISLGTYGEWSYEVVVYPNVDPSSISSDQNLSAFQLGNAGSPGSILGVLDYQSGGGALLSGSLENEIVTSQPSGATAIPLSNMTSSRASVGGTITP